MRLTK